jgi:tRNA1(Val) A37 N6-methylase TrmN6
VGELFLAGKLSVIIVLEKIGGFLDKMQMNLKIKENKKDRFSAIFEAQISAEERHLLGQYFTHQEIVDFIINQIPLKKGNKVLDPTCGAGAFLGKIKEKGIESKDIYGSDIDPRALTLCKDNLKQNNNLLLGNFLTEELFKENFFDVIVGNPPFQNLSKKQKGFSLKHKHFLQISGGTTNSASLVLIRSYFLLKEGGYLGLVLPKNFVRVDSFKKIRKFILENMQIILIKDLDHHFKDVRCDQIILIAQKKKPQLNKAVKIITYKKKVSFLSQEKYSLKQSELLEYPFLPIFYSKKIKSIADKLLSIEKTLLSESDIFRGESIGFFKKEVSSNISENILLRGNCIERFGIKNRLYLNQTKDLISSKIQKMKQEKIIIQNIASKEGGIFPVISRRNELTMDTITNIIPKDKEHLKFINCLLGSRFCNFFMIHVIYLNSNFSMHTDKTYIGQLPIIYPDKIDLIKVNTLYDRLSKIKDKYSEEFKKEYSELNKIIYSLYKLNGEEIEIIEQSLREVMSKKNG